MSAELYMSHHICKRYAEDGFAVILCIGSNMTERMTDYSKITTSRFLTRNL